MPWRCRKRSPPQMRAQSATMCAPHQEAHIRAGMATSGSVWRDRSPPRERQSTEVPRSPSCCARTSAY
eukprot:3104052-Pyramimonas_sp.AAC.1